jgi:hypothetical protein
MILYIIIRTTCFGLFRGHDQVEFAINIEYCCGGRGADVDISSCGSTKKPDYEISTSGPYPHSNTIFGLQIQPDDGP